MSAPLRVPPLPSADGPIGNSPDWRPQRLSRVSGLADSPDMIGERSARVEPLNTRRRQGELLSPHCHRPQPPARSAGTADGLSLMSLAITISPARQPSQLTSAAAGQRQPSQLTGVCRRPAILWSMAARERFCYERDGLRVPRCSRIWQCSLVSSQQPSRWLAVATFAVAGAGRPVESGQPSILLTRRKPATLMIHIVYCLQRCDVSTAGF